MAVSDAIRKRIWVTLKDTKFKSYLLGFLMEKYQKWDRNINIFLAIASSSSIAAWAYFKVHPEIWAAIIAASQVMTVIKPYFPYYKYAKELDARCYKIEVLNLQIERLWNNIERGKVTDDQADELYYDYHKQLTDILNFGVDNIFDIGNSMIVRANVRTAEFMKIKFNVKAIINKPKT